MSEQKILQTLAAAEKAGLLPNTVHHWLPALLRYNEAFLASQPKPAPVLLTDEEFSKIRATSIAFERHYSDNSGVEFGVRFDGVDIEFEHIVRVDFPVEELDWLIAALQRIKAEVMPLPAPPERGV